MLSFKGRHTVRTWTILLLLVVFHAFICIAVYAQGVNDPPDNTPVNDTAVQNDDQYNHALPCIGCVDYGARGIICNGLHAVITRYTCTPPRIISVVWTYEECKTCNYVGYLPNPQYSPKLGTYANGNPKRWLLALPPPEGGPADPDGHTLWAAEHPGTGDITPRDQLAADALGITYGCHNCGRVDSLFTNPLHWTADHIKPTNLFSPDELLAPRQWFSPHCAKCYRVQGAKVKWVKARLTAYGWFKTGAQMLDQLTPDVVCTVHPGAVRYIDIPCPD